MSNQDAADALYWYCVDFVIYLANLTGVTYADASALLFLIALPALTLILLATTIYRAIVLNRI